MMFTIDRKNNATVTDALKCLLLFCFVFLLSGKSAAQDSQSRSDDFVYLLNADEIRYSELLNPDAQLLVGNVVFRHDSMYMYCDSALFFQKVNSFNAYSNVRTEQGDTLFMFGDSLLYDGITRIAHLRGEVRLENRDMILLTDSLNYDRNTSLGYFFNGGTLLDAENTLTSDYGEYDTDAGIAIFRRDVVLESPDYTMNTDTLVYDAEGRVARFVCPTTIVSENNVIETRNGWLETETKNSVLLDRSVLSYSDGEQLMTGDSIVYNDADSLVWGFGNAVINDYSDHIDVHGDYVFFDRTKDSAVVTGRALAIEYSSGDSLFLHADTFKLRTIYGENDSVLNRQVKAYHKVMAFRTDVQMVCDSLEFETVDSCLTLYKDPVVWSDGQQILGEVIKAYMNDSTIERAVVSGQALSVERIDDECFNQISGREITGFFVDGDIDRALVDGNVQVVYYPFDSDSIMIGMNVTEASNMEAFFISRKVHKIVVHESSSGVLYPMDQRPPEKLKLPNFVWLSNLRPRHRDDIFFWREKEESEKLHVNKLAKDIPLPSLPVVHKK